VIEMIDKVTIWNKSGERLDIEIKMIAKFLGMIMDNEEARTFSPKESTLVTRELVLEIHKYEEEEEKEDEEEGE